MSWAPKGEAVDGQGRVISFTLSFGLDNGTQIKLDGEYADPRIAYKGILMNYWNVYDCMDEVEEPTDDDWLSAVSNLFDSYTYDVENTDVDKFKMSGVMNVYRIINP